MLLLIDTEQCHPRTKMGEFTKMEQRESGATVHSDKSTSSVSLLS